MAELGRSFIIGADGKNQSTEEELEKAAEPWQAATVRPTAGRTYSRTDLRSDSLLVRRVTFCRAELFLPKANFCCCSEKNRQT